MKMMGTLCAFFPNTTKKTFLAFCIFEADPANAAYMYLTDLVCVNCFQDCYEPEDGIQQINTCADECKCGRKRTMEPDNERLTLTKQ